MSTSTASPAAGGPATGTWQLDPSRRSTDPVVIGSYAVSTQHLSKRYPTRSAVDDLDLRLEHGAVTGFVGPNGAGKTTTIRMLLGLIAPSDGAGSVLGEPIDRPERYLPRVGAMIEGPAFYPSMTGRLNLRVLCQLGGIPERRIDEVLELVDLTDRQHDRFKSYSLGMKQRLGLAAALLPDPELLILDEPTNGLDPAGIRDIRAILRDLGDRGVTVSVSSHLLSEIEVICDHLVLIAGGRLRYQGPVQELTQSQHTRILAEPEHASDLDTLRRLCESAALPASIVNGQLHVDVPPGRAAWLNRAAFDSGITLTALTVERPNLEEVFFAMTETPVGVAA
jgi:ABC-2 type transport system ATP-binding protein